jgi:hypothetical protein
MLYYYQKFLLIAIAVVIGLVLHILVSTPTKAHAQEGIFLTYEDPTSLFTIQYPTDWKIVVQKDGYVSFFSPLDFSTHRQRSFLIVNVNDTTESSLTTIIEKEKARLLQQPYVHIVNDYAATLSGLPARRITTDLNTDEIFTLIPANSKIFLVIYYIGGGSAAIADSSTIQQMVSSFKIITNDDNNNTNNTNACVPILPCANQAQATTNSITTNTTKPRDIFPQGYDDGLRMDAMTLEIIPPIKGIVRRT